MKSTSRLVAAACAGSFVMALALAPQAAVAQSVAANGAPSGTGQNTVGDPKTGAYVRSPAGPDMGAEDVNGAPSGTGQATVGDPKMGGVVRPMRGADMGSEGVNGAPSGTGQNTVGDPKN
jgi:hypothetical protein